MHLKYSVTGNEVEDDEFYRLDIVDKYDDEAMAKHIYKDPVQLGVHIILCRSLIKMFTTFHYKEDPNTKDFTAHYPFHHELMLVPIIDIVKDEFSRYCTDINLSLDELAQECDTDAHRVLSSHMNMVMSSNFTSAYAQQCHRHYNNGEHCQTYSEMSGHIPCKEKLEQSWSKCWKCDLSDCIYLTTNASS